MKAITILIAMQLAGQAKAAAAARKSEQGYAMAALLVAMSIMAVMMTVAMPVWKHAAQREKEEELVFRGRQYVHAIGLFQRKFANAYPPNIDVLVDQRFLRKKYKDPITNDDFVPLPVGQGTPGTPQQPGQRGQPGATGATGATGRGQSPTSPSTAQQPGRGASPFGGGPGVGVGTTAGISGVTSKSKAQSIRLYNGRGHYNEWAFVYIPQVQAPGAGAPGTAVPGQIPGQRGQPNQPGQRGQPGPFDPGQRGRGGFGNPTGGPGGFGNPQQPGGGRGFGPGQTPIQPPNFPRGRQ
jgi:type II secretory pathway pseudopilin PulG